MATFDLWEQLNGATVELLCVSTSFGTTELFYLHDRVGLVVHDNSVIPNGLPVIEVGICVGLDA